jgi:hypothetical protein
MGYVVDLCKVEDFGAVETLPRTLGCGDVFMGFCVSMRSEEGELDFATPRGRSLGDAEARDVRMRRENANVHIDGISSVSRGDTLWVANLME